MDKVYVVEGSVSDYSGSTEWLVRGFTDPIVAEQFRLACEKEADRVREESVAIPEQPDAVYPEGYWTPEWRNTPAGRDYYARDVAITEAKRAIVSKYDARVNGDLYGRDYPDYAVVEVEMGWPK